jgi:hypothetical protein
MPLTPVKNPDGDPADQPYVVAMALRLHSLVWDSPDPGRLARFWADALDWQIGDESDDEVELAPTDGTSFTFLFGASADENVNPYRIHLDLSSQSSEDQQ